jgi:WD40 repeat protein
VLSLVVVGYAYHAWRQSKAATIASVIRTAASMVDSDPTAAALVLATLTADSELDYVMPIATQVAHGSLATILRGHAGSVFSAVFSPDNTRIATAGEDGTARIWRADGTGEPVTLRGHAGWVFSAVFSPDNTRVVTAGDDGTARVWRADGTGEPIVLRHGLRVRSAAFSSDNARIVTAGDDGTARLWRADGTGELVVLRGHAGAVGSASFNPDNTRIVTIGDDGTARVWHITWPALLEILRSETKTCLTIDERRRYVGESESDARQAWKDCESANGRSASR